MEANKDNIQQLVFELVQKGHELQFSPNTHGNKWILTLNKIDHVFNTKKDVLNALMLIKNL